MQLTLLLREAQVITRACATEQTLKPLGRQESHFPSLGDKWGMQRKANYAVHIFTVHITTLCTSSLYTHYVVHIFTVYTTMLCTSSLSTQLRCVCLHCIHTMLCTSSLSTPLCCTHLHCTHNMCTPLVTTFQLGHSSGQVPSLLSGTVNSDALPARLAEAVSQ